MFKIYHKVSKRTYTVYAVNGLHFMVWDAQKQLWLWMPVTECEPVEEG